MMRALTIGMLTVVLTILAACGRQNSETSPQKEGDFTDAPAMNRGVILDSPTEPSVVTDSPNQQKNRPLVLAVETKSGAIVCHVDDVMKNPAGFPDEITILGVVFQTDSGRHLVMLIDAREFDACREVNCATLVLPVEWHGVMPVANDRVKISGRIVNHGGKFAFTASKMESSSS